MKAIRPAPTRISPTPGMAETARTSGANASSIKTLSAQAKFSSSRELVAEGKLSNESGESIAKDLSSGFNKDCQTVVPGNPISDCIELRTLLVERMKARVKISMGSHNIAGLFILVN